MNEDIILPIAGMITGIVMMIGLPLTVLHIWRTVKGVGKPTTPPEVLERLERMEHSIDAIAVEVERIAEGQRFTTKLLSDRAAAEPARLPPRREPGA